jgi:hypothetical protein
VIRLSSKAIEVCTASLNIASLLSAHHLNYPRVTVLFRRPAGSVKIWEEVSDGCSAVLGEGPLATRLGGIT